MKTRIVPANEISAEKGLKAENYMEKPDPEQDDRWYYLRAIIEDCHTNAKNKGWWDKYGQGAQADRVLHDFKPDIIAAKLMLVSGELGEALEEVRDGNPGFYYAPDGSGKPEGVGVELADVVIRVFDLASWLGIDLADMIRLKMEYNRTRPYLHGGKRL